MVERASEVRHRRVSEQGSEAAQKSQRGSDFSTVCIAPAGHGVKRPEQFVRAVDEMHLHSDDTPFPCEKTGPRQTRRSKQGARKLCARRALCALISTGI